jgi:hypothetical protein
MMDDRPAFTEKRLAHIVAAILIAAAVVVCFHKLALHPGDVLVGPQSGGENDLTNYYIPSRTFFRKSVLSDHVLTNWNSSLSFGTAYIGNAQSAVFYPPNWLTVLFDPTWFLSWLQLGHHWWIGLGMYFLCRSQNLSFGSSLFGGITLACAPFLIAQGAEGHYAQIAASSWIPWAFLSLHYYLIQPSRRIQISTAFCFAMSFLCSHPQETYYLVLLGSVLVLFESCRCFVKKEKTLGSKLLTGWVWAGMITMGLVAIDLVPIYFNSRTTPRGLSAVSPELMGWAAYDLEHLWQLVAPFSIDRPEIWQRGTPPFWEKIGYFGVVPICLAATAVIVGLKERWVRRMTVLVIVTLLIAMGTNSYLFPLMLKLVPGTSWFRLPSRILFFTSFGVAFLAAYGVHFLQSGTKSKTPRAVASIFIILLGAAAAATCFRFQISTADFSISKLMKQSLIVYPLFSGIITCVYLMRKKSSGKSFAIVLTSLLLVATVCEFTQFAVSVTDTAVVEPLKQRSPELVAALEKLQAEKKFSRLLTIQELVSDQDAIQNQLPKARGYDPAGSIFYLSLINRFSKNVSRPVDPTGFSQVKLADASQNLLNAAGISHVLQVHRKNFSEAPEDWKLLWSDPMRKRVRRRESPDAPPEYKVELFENPNALPKAYVVGNVRLLQQGSDLKKLISETDFRKEVILGVDVLDSDERSTFQPAQITLNTPDQLEMEVDLSAPGYLVVSDLWFPGWTATVDGTRVKILRGNLSFRVVPLPAGKHTVKMSFRPPGFQFGMIITLLTLGFALWQFMIPPAQTDSPSIAA